MNDICITINLEALAANYRHLSRLAAPVPVAAVVKADAYGLGCEQVVPVLLAEGCRNFFVATFEEARRLTPLLPPDCKPFVLNGFAPADAEVALQSGAIPVVNTPAQLRAWHALAAAQSIRLPLALQLDTGMSRLGLQRAELAAIAADTTLWSRLDLRLVMTHLACADEMASPANTRQRLAFDALAAQLPPTPRSIANSAGIFLDASFHGDLARAGIALYGGKAGDHAGDEIRPVVELAARVIQLRDISAGDAVGYGGQFVATTRRRIATVGVGYADGVPRAIGDRGHAWVAGERVPIVGRVSMDSLALDVSALPRDHVDEGCWAMLLGDRQSIDDLAADAGTIGYEILTRLGRRAERRYVPAAAAALPRKVAV